MDGPCVIGATGGSGTRVVARIVRRGGLFIGTNLNVSRRVSAPVKHLVVCLLFCSSVSLATASRLGSCLPPGVALSDVVSRGLTVEGRLLQLNARCEGDKLLEPGGKEIRSPSDAQEILDRQRTELEELSRRYTMIEMTCYTGG